MTKRADSCVMPFHVMTSVTLAAASASVAVQPANLGARILTEADAWALYRLKSFRFRLYPVPAIAAADAMGWADSVPDTLPNTIGTIGVLVPSVLQTAGQSIPTEWMSIPAKSLQGPFPWYKTVAGTADVTEEVVGTLCFAGGATDTLYYELRGEIEFKGALPTTSTPLALELRSKLREERRNALLERERKELLKVFSLPTPPKEK